MVVARMDTGSNSYLTLACVAGFLGFGGGERGLGRGKEGKPATIPLNVAFLPNQSSVNSLIG